MTLISYRKFYFLFIFLFFVSLHSLGQQTQLANVNDVVLSTSDRTYVSFGQGIGSYKTPYKKQKLNPLIFEGQISPDFFLNMSRKRTIGLAFFPKVVIRMYNEPSVPVKTPSYMPSILFYHTIKSPFTKHVFPFIKTEEQLALVTYRLIHHSNGQNGSYFIPGTDSINYKNGNFSTNAFEVALSWSVIDSNKVTKTFLNGRVAYERQLDLERETGLRDKYYYNKITVESRFIYSERINAYITYGFMWGTPHFVARHSLDIFCSVKLFQKLSDFSLFLRGYMGPDYYNIYYMNSLKSITIGIIADPLRIPFLKKEKKKV
ncbi:MAG: hypothetical protein H0W84_10120 [Bacteroidetes bacterium]|nr:hypothetical protein [Bacteroidota bacterium]